MKKLKIIALVALSMLIFSCTPQDLLRDFDFISNIFYPEVYQRKDLGDETPGTAFDHSGYRAVLNEFLSDEGEVDYNRLAATPAIGGFS